MHGMFRTPRESRVRMRPIIRIRCDEDRSCDRAVSCAGALVEGRRTDRLAVRTKGVLRRMQNDNGSVERNSPAIRLSSDQALSPAAASPQTVLGDSDAPMNWTHPKRPHFAGPFLKRLKGFEPSTFCMASRARGNADWPDLPANKRLSMAQWAADYPGFQREITGVRGPKAD